MEKEAKFEWLVLVTVIVGTFLGRIDQTIVNLALPKIIDAFSVSVSSAAWIATAYILANAVFVPIWGKLGDTVGRKKIYLLGFVVFIIGSVLAGLAWNLSSLIVFRVIQAIASSADYPTAMAIIAVTFTEEKKRAQALGIWTASFVVASVLGPLIGGPLIDIFGWRSVFLINLPIGIVGYYMAKKFVKESVSEKKANGFDWWGTITLAIALSALVLVLDQGSTWGWSSTYSVIAYFSIVIFFLLFIFIEKGHHDPLMDLKLFKNGTFVTTLLNNFVVFMGLMGSIFLIPIFAQTYMGYSATESGYLFIPLAFFLAMFAPIGAKFVGKVKASYIIAISTFVAAIGMFWMGHTIDPRSTALDIIIPLSVLAGGMGLGMAQRTSIIASIAPKEEIGMASSVLALVRNISGAFGVAIFATILTSLTESNIINLSKNTVINSHSPEVFKQVAALIILKAQVLAYNSVFIISGVIVLIGAILALFIKVKYDVKDKKGHVTHMEVD